MIIPPTEIRRGLFENLTMNQIDRLFEIVATYEKHGWKLRSVLMTAETSAGVADRDMTRIAAPIEASTIDAIWFSRASHDKREAWELRLVADTPYALFETFAADDPAELCADMRLEMEARMREHGERLTGELLIKSEIPDVSES